MIISSVRTRWKPQLKGLMIGTEVVILIVTITSEYQ